MEDTYMITYCCDQVNCRVHMDPRLLLNPNLTPHAKAAYAVILALDPDTAVSAHWLAKIMGTSYNAVLKSLQQLESARYLCRYTNHTSGRYRGIDYVLFSNPEINPNHTHK